jgi:hypothetical protein
VEKLKLEEPNEIPVPENCPACKIPMPTLIEMFGLLPVLQVGQVNPIVCPNCGCWFTPKKALIQIIEHLVKMKNQSERKIVTPDRKLTLVH